MTLCAVFPQNSAPLSADEKRLIWEQLHELREARLKIAAYENYISPDRQKLIEDAYEMKLQAQEEMISLRTQERDFEREKAAFYKSAYESVSKKKGGFGCKMKRIFTFGIARPCK